MGFHFLMSFVISPPHVASEISYLKRRSADVGITFCQKLTFVLDEITLAARGNSVASCITNIPVAADHVPFPKMGRTENFCVPTSPKAFSILAYTLRASAFYFGAKKV